MFCLIRGVWSFPLFSIDSIITIDFPGSHFRYQKSGFDLYANDTHTHTHKTHTSGLPEVVHTLPAWRSAVNMLVRHRRRSRHDAQDASHPSGEVAVSCCQEGSLEGHKACQNDPKDWKQGKEGELEFLGNGISAKGQNGHDGQNRNYQRICGRAFVGSIHFWNDGTNLNDTCN